MGRLLSESLGQLQSLSDSAVAWARAEPILSVSAAAGRKSVV